MPGNGFEAMGLSPIMLKSLERASYLEPTPIQAGLIPRAMAGVDVMGQAQTGTGKTAAFAIPILELVKPHRKAAPPQALVLVPTRELAVQVRDECIKLAAGATHPHRGRLRRQAASASRPSNSTRASHLVVGTPGRVLDLMGRGTLMLGEVRFVVLDEADRMLDIGFRPDIEKILRRCPQSRQTMLLKRHHSAAGQAAGRARTCASRNRWISPQGPVRGDDRAVLLHRRSGAEVRLALAAAGAGEAGAGDHLLPHQAGDGKIHRRLAHNFKGVDTIYGDLPQKIRDRVMQGFREGKIRWLVATDVVGRGIDVTTISHIINYDIPQFCDDYVHRVGRTGRMGREGVAYTFVTPEEGNELTRIEMRINRLLMRDEMEGMAVLQKPEASAELPAEVLDEQGQPVKAAPTPVFGRRTRRLRRAL